VEIQAVKMIPFTTARIATQGRFKDWEEIDNLRRIQGETPTISRKFFKSMEDGQARRFSRPIEARFHLDEVTTGY